MTVSDERRRESRPFAVTAAVLVVAAALIMAYKFGIIGDPLYKRDIRHLQGRLDALGSIPKIQTWLASERDRRNNWFVREGWPQCIRELAPSYADLTDEGGVSLWWHKGDAIGVVVYPSGQRPTLPARDDYYGYRAPLGNDAYIWMRFK